MESSGKGPGAKWRYGPPLGEAAVAAFETEHGIRLPEAYRRFATSIGDGADGPPHYGLVRLGQAAGITGHEIAPGSLSEPFPLTDSWIWEDDPSAVDAKVAAVHRSGILPLGTDGDGMDYVLVVTGPSRGQVWMVTGEGATPISADFGRWMAGDVLPDAEWTLRNRRLK